MSLTKRRKVVLDLAVHFILAVVLSLLVYLRSGNLFYALIFIGGGIFVDLDHFIDHFMFFGNKFRFNDFLVSRFLRSGKVYLFLHSWEITCLIFLIASRIRSGALMILSLSLATHLAVDNLHRGRPLFYLLIYRFIKRFDVGYLLPEEDIFA